MKHFFCIYVELPAVIKVLLTDVSTVIMVFFNVLLHLIAVHYARGLVTRKMSTINPTFVIEVLKSVI